MGEEQRLSPEEQLATARAAFEGGTDFTVAVEEEFALLDRETLALANRFEEVQAAAAGTEVEPHLVGELIASEAEVRTGKCADFGEAAAKMVERRGAAARARARARALRSAPRARIRGAAGRTSGSSTRRTTGATTSCSATSSGATTPSGCTSTSASAAATARSPSATRCGASCPSCSRCRRARRSSRRSTPACTRRARRSSRACSRAAGSPTPTTAGRASRTTSRFLYRTGSIDEHTQLWWSVRPHLAYPTVEIRICDAQPDLAEAQSLAALAYALAARCARAHDEGEPLPDLPQPPARGEPLARDPLRAPGRADRLRARRARSRAGAARAADRVGRARSPRRSARRRSSPCPAANAAERQRGEVARGRDPRADLRRAGRR